MFCVRAGAFAGRRPPGRVVISDCGYGRRVLCVLYMLFRLKLVCVFVLACLCDWFANLGAELPDLLRDIAEHAETVVCRIEIVQNAMCSGAKEVQTLLAD